MRAEKWNFSWSVQLDISRVSAVNECDMELITSAGNTYKALHVIK